MDEDHRLEYDQLNQDVQELLDRYWGLHDERDLHQYTFFLTKNQLNHIKNIGKNELKIISNGQMSKGLREVIKQHIKYYYKEDEK
jgi:hypothetical protein